MCGRFSLATNQKKLAESFAEFKLPEEMAPRHNIAPSQPVAVVANNGQGQVEFFQWGLVPAWAKDPAVGNRLINARSETLAEKPSFKNAYKRRRCLVLADGFYEWRKEPNSKAKTPMYIQLLSKEPFAFAGLWESWHGADGSHLLSCTIITTTPNELMADIHNRMPVLLPPETYPLWLDPAERNPAELKELLKPYPAAQMIAYPVSKVVNNPRNDTPDCITPLPTTSNLL
ncbi:MAG: SOS response-associated peptidase [Anaerolineae bacterium]|nr:SOS response-associated peptidase [Anaerolineae bacterium]